MESLSSAINALVIVNLLACSGTEVLAILFHWRQNLLLQQIKVLINEPATGLATTIYGHPLISWRCDDGVGEKIRAEAAYIDPGFFAQAFCKALGLTPEKLNVLKGKSAPEISEWFRTEMPMLNSDEQLRTLLLDCILCDSAEIDKIHNVVANWFAISMEHATETYERRAKLSCFIIGFLIATVFDVSPLPLQTAKSVEIANLSTKDGYLSPRGQAPTEAILVARSNSYGGKNRERSEPAPVLNPTAMVPRTTGFIHLLGWLLTALSTVTIAPFWFDTLTKSSRRRSGSSSPRSVLK